MGGAGICWSGTASARTGVACARTGSIGRPPPARSSPRAVPEEPLQLLCKAIGEAPFPCRARVPLAGTVETLAARIPPWLGALEADGPAHCWLGLGAPSMPALAANLLLLDLPFDAIGPDQARTALTQALNALCAQLERLPQ